jgi:hypothetical protein
MRATRRALHLNVDSEKYLGTGTSTSWHFLLRGEKRKKEKIFAPDFLYMSPPQESQYVPCFADF